MWNQFFVSNLAFVSLFVVPACVDDIDEIDDGGDPGVQLGTAESALSSYLCPPNTPAALAPPVDQDLASVLDATGVQKYSCNATATGAAWTFVAPQAVLYEGCNHAVGTHYAGPTWESGDGSTVVGAKVAGATIDPTAVPWLLLSVPSHGGPAGKMTSVTAIQRLATTGGNAPATGCDAARIGATINVPYTAKYFFYRTRTSTAYNTRCGASH